jgi:NADH-quinone oxidoreductase subunit L
VLYIGRLWFLTFGGGARSERAEHAHESPPIFWVPLAVLAAAATLAGLLSTSPEGQLESWLRSVVGVAEEGTQGLATPVFYAIAIAITLVGIVVAWWVYGTGQFDWQALRDRLEPLPRSALNGWYVDRAYDTAVIQPAKTGARITAYVVDAGIIDGAVNAVGGGVKRLAQGGRLIQTGFVRTYALVLFVGTVAILAYVGVRL